MIKYFFWFCDIKIPKEKLYKMYSNLYDYVDATIFEYMFGAPETDKLGSMLLKCPIKTL